MGSSGPVAGRGRALIDRGANAPPYTRMTAPPENRQRIARLMPLDDVLRLIAESVAAVRPRDMRAGAALGATLAQDIVVAERHPPAPMALTDGRAVHTEATADAGGYAPARLSAVREVAVGKTLPSDADAVMPFEVVTSRAGQYEAHTTATAGDGVLMSGADADAGEVLRQSGHRLRAIDVAAMQALGVAGARVRKPRIRVARVGKGRNDILDAIADWISYAVAADGGEPVATRPGADIVALLTGAGVDAVVMVGGTGASSRDDAVQALARCGAVAAHGIAVSPGETAAFGIAEARPVLLVPGRLDAAIAVWLLLGRAMLARLRGGTIVETGTESLLAGKIASTVGLAELVPVRRVATGVEPLASRYLPLATLAHADGWIVVPTESEGLPAGAHVNVRPLP